MRKDEHDGDYVRRPESGWKQEVIYKNHYYTSNLLERQRALPSRENR